MSHCSMLSNAGEGRGERRGRPQAFCSCACQTKSWQNILVHLQLLGVGGDAARGPLDQSFIPGHGSSTTCTTTLAASS